MKIQDKKLSEYVKWMRSFMDPHQYHEHKTKDGIKRYYPKKLQKDLIGNKLFTRNNYASLNNTQWLQHVSGIKTFGYNNNQRNIQQLICIDLDPKDKLCMHNEAIFRKCIKRINEFFNRNIFWERSTNYKNWHGYLIFNKERTDTESFCELLEKLESILTKLCPELARVELLARPNYYNYDYSGIVNDIQNQTPVKIPRDYQRFNEMLQIGTVEIDDLWKMTDNYKVKKKLKNGSGKELDLSFLNTAFMQSIQELTASIFSSKLSVREKKVIFDDVLACCIVTYIQTINNMKTSVECARRTWNTLKEQGWIDRGFDYGRWAVCRNILSQNGLIDWKEHEYTPPGSYSGTGEELKGKCCIYSFTEEVMAAVNIKGGGSPSGSFINFKNIQKLGQNLVPVRKRGIFFVSSSPEIPIWERNVA
jgi:hypothetical protein